MVKRQCRKAGVIESSRTIAVRGCMAWVLGMTHRNPDVCPIWRSSWPPPAESCWRNFSLDHPKNNNSVRDSRWPAAGGRRRGPQETPIVRVRPLPLPNRTTIDYAESIRFREHGRSEGPLRSQQADPGRVPLAAD